MTRTTSPRTVPCRWRHRAAVIAAVGTLVVAVGACGSDEEDTSETGDATVAEDVLGEPNPATDSPVKVGFVSDGRTVSVDNSAFPVAAQATVDYVNEYEGGIGGHEIDLVACETEGEPGKATACANELVQDGVVLTIMPETISPAAVHTVLSENGVPLFVYAVTDPVILEDPDDTFNLGGLAPALAELPIAVAEENDIEKVSVMVVDVPAATAGYEGALATVFDDAGIELEVIKIPLGQADLSQQINEIVTGDPTVAFLVGDDTLCISAMNGLRVNGFTDPIAAVPNCFREAVIEAVGANIEGASVASLGPSGDDANGGIQLWNAILAEYAPDFGDPDVGLSSFMTTYSALQVLADMTGDITPETVSSTIRNAPELPLVTGEGLGFRCNGKADPANPAVCTRGALKVSYDADGTPALPWVPFGDTPIPD